MNDKGNMHAEEIRAEAAAWLARLRSDAPAPADRAGFQAWLNEDPSHGEAFEAVTAVWDLVGGVEHARPMRPPVEVNRTRRAMMYGIAAVLAVGIAGGGGLWWLNRPMVYMTAIGEQRRVALNDGTFVNLDTDTQITVRYTEGRRDISLDHGRAYFDVVHNSKRPFVVEAGLADVKDVGTAFDVDREKGSLSVILQHGRADVTPRAPGSKDYSLKPGERIVVNESGQVTRDRPDVAQLLSWLTGRLTFKKEALVDAIADMNRYSTRRLVIADPKIADLPISGLFSVGDNEAFARSLTTLLPVAIDVQPTEIVLYYSRNGRARDPS